MLRAFLDVRAEDTPNPLIPADYDIIYSSIIFVALLIVVATIGNVLGSAINWWLGRYIEHFRDRRWFPFTPATLERATGWYHRYGRWSLLLSWMPIIGDPLTLVAGVLREPLPTFIAIVTAAKLGRYLVLAAVTLHWMA